MPDTPVNAGETRPSISTRKLLEPNGSTRDAGGMSQIIELLSCFCLTFLRSPA